MSFFKITHVQSDPFQRDRDELVWANLAREAETATGYFVLIDLDGTGYKHDLTAVAARITEASGKAVKTNSGGKWSVRTGVILAINGTQATIGFLTIASVNLRNTSAVENEDVIRLFPNWQDTKVSGGDFAKIATSLTEVTTSVNTAITLVNARGDSVTPAVGDVLVKVENISGGGSVAFAISTQYFVELP